MFSPSGEWDERQECVRVWVKDEQLYSFPESPTQRQVKAADSPPPPTTTRRHQVGRRFPLCDGRANVPFLNMP